MLKSSQVLGWIGVQGRPEVEELNLHQEERSPPRLKQEEKFYVYLEVEGGQRAIHGKQNKTKNLKPY